MSADDPIGLFDSGLGGLTVMREVIRLLPNEHLIYFGDTARLPYGNKSPQTILRYTLENVSFLLQHKIKCLIIACFTASAHALQELEQRLQIPVIGVIKCGLDKLLLSTSAKRVAILGTTSTIQSGLVQSLIHQKNPSIEIFPVACPLFVPFIEEGLSDHPTLRSIVSHYLGNLKEIDAALLACTHYPLIRSVIQESFGPKTQLIGPAEFCALQTQQSLSSLGLLRKETDPTYRFYVTDHPEKFQALATPFLGSTIDQITLVDFP